MNGATDDNVWRVCSSCRKSLYFDRPFYECSVSTCTRGRIPLSFCSVACWDAHLSDVRHRESWAVEARAPSRAAHLRAQADEGSRARSAPMPVAAAPVTPRPFSVGPQVRPAAPAFGAPPYPQSASPSTATGAAVAVSLSPNFDKDDVLVVVSKLKKFVRDRSGMNTSDGVVELLSEHLRFVCDEAVRNAAADGRKTVLDRDVKPVTARWRIVR